MKGTPRSLRQRRGGMFKARAVAAVAVLAVGLSACGSGGSGGDVTEVPTAAAGQDPLAPRPLEEKATVTVGLSSKLEVYLPILLAQEFGEFEKENLEVKVEYLPPTDSSLLLTQGELDVVYSGFTAGVLNLVSRNDDVKFAYPGGTASGDQQGIYLNTKSFPDADNLKGEDFRGKKFMTSSGTASSTSYFLWKRVTELPGGAGIKPTDLKFEAAKLPEIPLILKNGAAAGGQIVSPNHTTLVGDKCCKVFEGAYPTTPQTGYLVGRSLSGKKDVAAALFRAMARVEKTHLQGNYHENEKILTAMAKVLEQDAGVLAKGDPVVFNPALATNAEVFPELQKFFREFGDVSYEEDLPTDQIYDTAYIESLGAKAT